jgi:hypothetical protein
VVGVLFAATVATGAPERHAAACGTTVGGHHWLVAPRGLSCAEGKGVVRKLAVKKVPAGGKWPGTYAGMKCVSTSSPDGKPQFIGCGSANQSRSLMAYRR